MKKVKMQKVKVKTEGDRTRGQQHEGTRVRLHEGEKMRKKEKGDPDKGTRV